MKLKIICLLLSALLVSCSQVSNPTVVVSEPNKALDNTKKDVVVKDVVVNNVIKPQVSNDIKVEVKESVKPIIDTNVGIKDSVNYILTGVDKAVENLPSSTPTASPNPTPYPTVLSTPIPVVTPTPVPDPRANDLRDTVPAGGYLMTPSPTPTKIPYRIDYPIVEYGNVFYELIFKDEYKVRYDKEKKQFYSLLGNDLKSVNDIFIKDNITIYAKNNYFSEDQANKIEQEMQITGRYTDYPNYSSEYQIYTNDISIKDFVLRGRENSFVRQFNVFSNQRLSH